MFSLLTSSSVAAYPHQSQFHFVLSYSNLHFAIPQILYIHLQERGMKNPWRHSRDLFFFFSRNWVHIFHSIFKLLANATSPVQYPQWNIMEDFFFFFAVVLSLFIFLLVFFFHLASLITSKIKEIEVVFIFMKYVPSLFFGYLNSSINN